MEHSSRRAVVAVVGAGIAGSALGARLAEAGVLPILFEKSRGSGGRSATRRNGELRFDHGAQYFTARDQEFARQVSDWRARGIAARWDGRVVRIDGGREHELEDSVERWVGVPGMSALAKDLARGLEIRHSARVRALHAHGRPWIEDDSGSIVGPFDAAVVTTPPEQAAGLLAFSGDLSSQVAAVASEPCWATMVAFERPLALAFEGAFIDGGALAWAARDSSKPGRPPSETWVLHAAADWSRRHLERTADEVAPMLLEEFLQLTGRPNARVQWISAHRWRYARPSTPLEDGFLWDPETRIGACGDWCLDARIEGAWISGTRLATTVLDALASSRHAEEEA